MTEELQAAPFDEAFLVDELVAGVLAGATELCGGAAALAVDGGRRELAERCAALDRALVYLGTVRDAIGQALGEIMEANIEELQGIAMLERSKTKKVEWNMDALHQDVRRSLIFQLCVDPQTGEVITNLARLAETVANRVTAVCAGGPPRIGGMKALELDADDYRATTWGGYRVKVTPIAQVQA